MALALGEPRKRLEAGLEIVLDLGAGGRPKRAERQVFLDGELGKQPPPLGRDWPPRSWSTPSTTAVMRPALNGTMPMMHFMSVLLPLPLVPSSTTVSPGFTSSVTSSSTRTAP